MSPEASRPAQASSQGAPGDAVALYEVAPRDGLQNEARVLPLEAKLRLIHGLVGAGFTDIEATSFVRPSWIPQLADAAELMRELAQVDGVNFWGLVPNARGLERALDAGLRHVATFMSASETHNRKNVNRTRHESLAILRDVIGTAKDDGVTVRSYISTVFGCPFEGAVPIKDSVRLAQSLIDAGADIIALGDTTGMADPILVQRVIAAMVAGGVPVSRLALHMHDTMGTALANVLAGFQAGVRTFDGSVAGVGGCPYAPGASGNAASEDLAHLFGAMGVFTGVDLDQAARTGATLATDLGRQLPGRYHRFWLGTRVRAETDRPAQTAKSA
ncbi:MAG: hydroxymethylglutaryl-CoA lyase [Oligoflexia bacterium]|nr:hydroxymethylglutaryl-CoA lyase [Oligoflexia bacterium]